MTRDTRYARYALLLALILPLPCFGCGSSGGGSDSEESTGPQAETFSFESTVSAVFDRGALPPGVTEDDTVTFVLALLLADATESATVYGICDPGATGCAIRGWTFPPVSYEITYSSGHSETQQVDRIEIVEGGTEDIGGPQVPARDLLIFYNGSTRVFQVYDTGGAWWQSGSVPASLVDAMADVAQPSLFNVSEHYALGGGYWTYHYDYVKPQQHTIVTRSNP